jgi:hypothetical protein
MKPVDEDTRDMLNDDANPRLWLNTPRDEPRTEIWDLSKEIQESGEYAESKIDFSIHVERVSEIFAAVHEATAGALGKFGEHLHLYYPWGRHVLQLVLQMSIIASTIWLISDCVHLEVFKFIFAVSRTR